MPFYTEHNLTKMISWLYQLLRSIRSITVISLSMCCWFDIKAYGASERSLTLFKYYSHRPKIALPFCCNKLRNLLSYVAVPCVCAFYVILPLSFPAFLEKPTIHHHHHSDQSYLTPWFLHFFLYHLVPLSKFPYTTKPYSVLKPCAIFLYPKHIHITHTYIPLTVTYQTFIHLHTHRNGTQLLFAKINTAYCYNSLSLRLSINRAIPSNGSLK